MKTDQDLILTQDNTMILKTEIDLNDRDDSSRSHALSGSTRFHYDSESGFVLNQATGEWLTTIEEVFDTMKAEIDDIFLQWEARQRDYDAAQAENAKD